MKKNLLSELSEKLKILKKYDAELFILTGSSQELSLEGITLENSEHSYEEGMGLRLFKDDKMAFVYSNSVEVERLELMFKEAGDILKVVQPDRYHKLPEIQGKEDSKDLDIFDRGLLDVNAIDRQDIMKDAVERALKQDGRIKKVLRSGFSQSESEINILNSRGAHLTEKSTYCGFGMSCIAEEAGEVQVGSCSESKRFFSDLDFNLIAEESARMAYSLLGGRKIPSGKRQILMHQQIAAEFLGLVASAVSADMLQKKKSFLAGAFGKKAGSAVLNIVDNARMPKGMASAYFDDEGVPTRRLDIIKNGMFDNILYDTYTADRDKTVSTGNAGRASYKSIPSPDTSNFYIEPGERSKDAIIAGISRGFYVLEVMGMHMADPISGDFSVGVSGINIKNGELTHAVSGVTLAGNMKDFLSNIAEIGNDIIFYDGFGAPVILIDGLMIGG